MGSRNSGVFRSLGRLGAVKEGIVDLAMSRAKLVMLLTVLLTVALGLPPSEWIWTPTRRICCPVTTSSES